jgi:hypothetical protein
MARLTNIARAVLIVALIVYTLAALVALVWTAAAQQELDDGADFWTGEVAGEC